MSEYSKGDIVRIKKLEECGFFEHNDGSLSDENERFKEKEIFEGKLKGSIGIIKYNDDGDHLLGVKVFGLKEKDLTLGLDFYPYYEEGTIKVFREEIEKIPPLVEKMIKEERL